MERSQEEKILAGLSHIALFFGWLGLIGQVVIAVLYREKSKFVFGHAKQGLALSVLKLVVGWVLGAFFGATIGLGNLAGGAFLAGGAIVGVLIAMAWLTLWVVLAIMGAVKGFNGNEYKQPLVGEMIDKIAA